MGFSLTDSFCCSIRERPSLSFAPLPMKGTLKKSPIYDMLAHRKEQTSQISDNTAPYRIVTVDSISCTGVLKDGEVKDEGKKNIKRNSSGRHLSRY